MRLGFDRLWLFLALALPALVALIVPLPAVDLAYQVRAGELIFATGAIPTTDTFTFTVAGAPWTDQQWLAQVLLALGYRLGGWELLAVVRAATVVLIVAFVMLAAAARGSSPRTASILALVAFLLSAPTLALRPQLFGILLFGVILWLVAGRRRHPDRLWLAPVAIVLWANIHGSVVLAPMLLGYAWLEDLVERGDHRRSLAVLVAGAVATLVNPFGLGVWGYALGLGTSPEITGLVSEWQRTTPFTVPGLLFYVSVVAVAAIAVARRARLTWPLVLWLVSLVVLGAWTVRGLAWWPPAAAVAVAGLLPAGESAARRPPPNVLNTLVAAAAVVALVAALPWWRPADPLTGRVGLLTYAPSGLALALRDVVRPGDRVYVPQVWGSWFEWAVPDVQYFTDSRIELYPDEVWRDDATIAAGDSDASAALDRWQVDLLVVQSPPRDGFVGPTGWTRTHEDTAGDIYERAGP